MRKERRMKRGIEPACVIAAVCLVLSLRQPDFGHTGLFPGCGIRGHLLFQFFHASVIHAALNCYCFILTVYRFKLSAFRIAMALCVAAIFPVSFLPAPAFPLGAGLPLGQKLPHSPGQLPRLGPKQAEHAACFFVGHSATLPYRLLCEKRLVQGSKGGFVLLLRGGEGLCVGGHLALRQTQRKGQRSLGGAGADEGTVRAGDEELLHIDRPAPGSAEVHRAHGADGVAAAGAGKARHADGDV